MKIRTTIALILLLAVSKAQYYTSDDRTQSVNEFCA